MRDDETTGGLEETELWCFDGFGIYLRRFTRKREKEIPE